MSRTPPPPGTVAERPMTGMPPQGGRAAPTRETAPQRWPEERIARLAEDAARHTPGVSTPVATVRADGHAARVDLDVAADHGEHLPTVAEAVRRRVAARIEAYAGVPVAAVTVTVVDLLLPAEDGGEAT